MYRPRSYLPLTFGRLTGYGVKEEFVVEVRIGEVEQVVQRASDSIR